MPSASQPVEVQTNVATMLESGDIFFLYLPQPGVRHVRGLDQVARTYFVLSPRPAHAQRARHQEGRHHRLFSLHALRLPPTQPGAHQGVWALLEQVAPSAEVFDHRLDALGNGKTVAEKQIALVRPAGEGRYALVDHGEHQHLAYVLELPTELGEVQRALRIAQRATYTLQVKAPDAASPLLVDIPPAYPGKLRELLAPWELAPLLDLALLDYPRAQVYLAPAQEDVVDEVGLKPDHEFNTTAETFSRLRLEAHLHPTAPLFTGDWA
ncbi:MAG: hypothetical protein HY690_08480 [Chloroflexi bacterium]|nr:hypothetical protein [Chloroflexota bacterium]